MKLTGPHDLCLDTPQILNPHMLGSHSWIEVDIWFPTVCESGIPGEDHGADMCATLYNKMNIFWNMLTSPPCAAGGPLCMTAMPCINPMAKWWDGCSWYYITRGKKCVHRGTSGLLAIQILMSTQINSITVLISLWQGIIVTLCRARMSIIGFVEKQRGELKGVFELPLTDGLYSYTMRHSALHHCTHHPPNPYPQAWKLWMNEQQWVDAATAAEVAKSKSLQHPTTCCATRSSLDIIHCGIHHCG